MYWHRLERKRQFGVIRWISAAAISRLAKQRADGSGWRVQFPRDRLRAIGIPQIPHPFKTAVEPAPTLSPGHSGPLVEFLAIR